MAQEGGMMSNLAIFSIACAVFVLILMTLASVAVRMSLSDAYRIFVGTPFLSSACIFVAPPVGAFLGALINQLLGRGAP